MIILYLPSIYEGFAAHRDLVFTTYISNFHHIYVLRLPSICPTASIYRCYNKLIIRLKLLHLADKGR